MSYLKRFSLVLFWMSILLWACKENKKEAPANIAISAPMYSELTQNGVTLQATISGDNLTGILKKGFCYDLNSNVDIAASTVESREAGTEIRCIATELSPNTTYYVKAFVTLLNAAPVYSSEISFTTAEIPEPPLPPDETLEELLAKYIPPAYADNYTGIAAWNQRSQWNLANVHDPTVMKADDGYYYMYQTNASYGNVHEGHGHFHARRSKDLVNWEYMGATMNTVPTWVKTKLNEMRASQGLPAIENPSYGYWAPVARKVDAGKYRMYYCIIINNYIKTGAVNIPANFDNSWTERAFIGLMETSDPASNVWEDRGYVVCSSTDRGANWARSSLNDWDGYFKWNAIDPSCIIGKSGEHWLVYGSWHSGIVALQLNAETGMPLNNLDNPWDAAALTNYGTLIYRRNNSRWQSSEAPEMIYNPETDYYYLFMAYDELSVAYNTRVSRSGNITGPYLGIDGTNVTAGGEMFPVVTHPYRFNNSHGWVGISHCAVFDDGDGNWFYSSQGRLPENVPGINASNAVMMGHVRSIRWTSAGWPVVMPERYGAVPQAPIKENELVGAWENIDMSYSYGNQKTATTITLGADHTITGAPWQGATWSYNAEKQILTANGIELCLQREVDWEATLRTHTIVYAGYNNQKTYWGKKIQ